MAERKKKIQDEDSTVEEECLEDDDLIGKRKEGIGLIALAEYSDFDGATSDLLETVGEHMIMARGRINGHKRRTSDVNMVPIRSPGPDLPPQLPRHLDMKQNKPGDLILSQSEAYV